MIDKLDDMLHYMESFSKDMIRLLDSNQSLSSVLDKVSDSVMCMNDQQQQLCSNHKKEIDEIMASIKLLPDSVKQVV